MIAGHKKIIKDLKTLCARGDSAQGYMFYGPSMVGKRTIALALSKFIEKGEFALPADDEILVDSKIIDLFSLGDDAEGPSENISIDAVREMRHFLFRKPIVSSRRTLIIDDADHLTTEAENALLKILEEPPQSSLLILITSDPDAIAATVASRLQKIYFGTLLDGDIEKWLAETRAMDPSAVVNKFINSNISEIVARSMGKPGLAYRLLNDEIFNKNLILAENFVKTTSATRKEFIKKLIEPEDFSLRRFLDSLIMVLAWRISKVNKANPTKPVVKTAARPPVDDDALNDLWHRTLALYGRASGFGLNPRLQLENLLYNARA